MFCPSLRARGSKTRETPSHRPRHAISAGLPLLRYGGFLAQRGITRLLLQRPVIEGTNGEKVNERASDTGIYLAGGLGILAFEGPVERRGDGIVHRFGKRAA